MDKNNDKAFNKRAFASLIAAITLAGLPITGYANHVYQFDPLTPQRHAWMTAHNTLAILFFASALWHLLSNGRALKKYAKGASSRSLSVSQEAECAVAVVAIALIVATSHVFILER